MLFFLSNLFHFVLFFYYSLKKKKLKANPYLVQLALIPQY
ncbi:hypothetical protein GRFL_0360 [Christiangramia flava JLT2011]|uniref:Uncharacterized protein n=1 Tax=Christiangramia flava JLT2011 TaxID=1229726 RepID=A0A1L7I1L1_9FLAO|nr:hypothetical protein GRFL_0360 [Christiangramia flava JLT2011]